MADDNKIPEGMTAVLHFVHETIDGNSDLIGELFMKVMKATKDGDEAIVVFAAAIACLINHPSAPPDVREKIEAMIAIVLPMFKVVHVKAPKGAHPFGVVLKLDATKETKH